MKVSCREVPAGPNQSGERMPSSGIFVDREGDWFYHEDRIIRQDILELFLTNLQLTSGGNFVIDWRGQCCALEVSDTPFIVTRVDRVNSEEPGQEQIQIMLKYLPQPEILDPSTLRIGKDNVPYCSVRKGQFQARFSRPAYYQLATWIEYDPGEGAFYLELNRRRFPLWVMNHPPGVEDLGE